MTLETFAMIARFSRSQRAKCSGTTPSVSSGGAAFGSRLTNTKPPQRATFTSGRQNPCGSTWGRSQGVGIERRLPSRFHAKPWNGHLSSVTRPP